MRLRLVGPCTLSACFFAITTPLAAQNASPRDSVRDDARFSFYDRGPYRPNVPRPETILGYEVGAFNTQFALQERTLLAIADAARDRVRVEEIGSTNERRTMRIYIISSPENIQRLDAIRADLDRIADPRGATQAELDAVVARTPAVVWINESVHGNESPGFETAMQTLYHFAASDEPATVAALRNALVILNPSTNPDGHERFTVWYNSINVNSPEPASLEKDEPWSIQGRFNHYRFDMNRDVMTSTQREVQALVRAQVKWHPMVAIDQHGQVGTYFFPPTAPPLNPNLRRRLRAVDGDLRAGQRRGVRPVRLDVLLARRLRFLRAVLLGQLAVALRRDRHDVRDGRRRLEGARLAPGGWNVAHVSRRHREAFHDRARDRVHDGGAPRRSACATISRSGSAPSTMDAPMR